MATPMTQRGAQLLKEELQRLKSIERPAVITAIAEARAQGDLSENAEYDAARERQGFIEGRIAELESKLSNAQVIDPKLLDADGRAVFGATVDLEDVESGDKVAYQIVGDDEADINRAALVSVPGVRADRQIGGDVAEAAARAGCASTRSWTCATTDAARAPRVTLENTGCGALCPTNRGGAPSGCVVSLSWCRAGEAADGPRSARCGCGRPARSRCRGYGTRGRRPIGRRPSDAARWTVSVARTRSEGVRTAADPGRAGAQRHSGRWQGRRLRDSWCRRAAATTRGGGGGVAAHRRTMPARARAGRFARRLGEKPSRQTPCAPWRLWSP
jgi:transcription elongation factor GreA